MMPPPASSRPVRTGLVLAAALAIQLVRIEPAAAQVMDREIHLFTLFEQLEYRRDRDAGTAGADLLGWVGGDFNRLWFKSDVSVATSERAGAGELQILYGRLVSPFWDLQAGVRAEALYTADDERGRVFAAAGIQGLAPGWFDVEVTAFVSHEGDVSARLSALHGSRLTQRLIAEPRVDFDAAIQEVAEFGVGNGPNQLELGLRLRYEIWRELAPYLGVVWERKLLETATMARAAGEAASEVSAVVGVRMWR